MMVDGGSTKEIADKLGCMPADVYGKLGYIARTWERKTSD
jgi:DNA-binding CsgD family transcriptional regulator